MRALVLPSTILKIGQANIGSQYSAIYHTPDNISYTSAMHDRTMNFNKLISRAKNCLVQCYCTGKAAVSQVIIIECLVKAITRIARVTIQMLHRPSSVCH